MLLRSGYTSLPRRIHKVNKSKWWILGTKSLPRPKRDWVKICQNAGLRVPKGVTGLDEFGNPTPVNRAPRALRPSSASDVDRLRLPCALVEALIESHLHSGQAMESWRPNVGLVLDLKMMVESRTSQRAYMHLAGARLPLQCQYNSPFIKRGVC